MALHYLYHNQLILKKEEEEAGESMELPTISLAVFISSTPFVEEVCLIHMNRIHIYIGGVECIGCSRLSQVEDPSIHLQQSTIPSRNGQFSFYFLVHQCFFTLMF